MENAATVEITCLYDTVGMLAHCHDLLAEYTSCHQFYKPRFTCFFNHECNTALFW
jgi:hypothetical protein